MSLIADSVIEFSGEAGLLANLNAVRHTPAKQGRPLYYSNESILRAVTLKFLLNERYFSDFAGFLEGSAQAQIFCKFDGGYTPCPATFSNFIRLLSAHADALWDVFAAASSPINSLIAEGKEKGGFADDAPLFGEILAIDSTDIESFGACRFEKHIDSEVPNPTYPEHCKSENPACCERESVDMDAQWGFRTDKNAPRGKGRFFGYKLHAIVDGYYGTVLHAVVLPANASDTRQLIPLMERVFKMYPWLAPKYLLADKGYDSVGNCAWLDSNGITPIIAVRRPKEDNEQNRRHEIEIKGPYGKYIQEVNVDGYLVCAGNRLMEYAGTDPERGHLFRCAKGGCRLDKRTLFPLYCEKETWVKPEGKALRVIGKIPRSLSCGSFFTISGRR